MQNESVNLISCVVLFLLPMTLISSCSVEQRVYSPDRSFSIQVPPAWAVSEHGEADIFLLRRSGNAAFALSATPAEYMQEFDIEIFTASYCERILEALHIPEELPFATHCDLGGHYAVQYRFEYEVQDSDRLVLVNGIATNKTYYGCCLMAESDFAENHPMLLEKVMQSFREGTAEE